MVIHPFLSRLYAYKWNHRFIQTLSKTKPLTVIQSLLKRRRVPIISRPVLVKHVFPTFSGTLKLES